MNEDGNHPVAGRTRRWFWVLAAVASVIVIGAAIAIPISISAAERAAKEDAAEEARAEAAAAERARLHVFGRAILDCDATNWNVKVQDGGETMSISRVTKSDGPTYTDMSCLLEEIGAPAAIEVAIGQTRALDGRQSDSWEGFEISWSYHPDSGANLLVQHAH